MSVAIYRVAGQDMAVDVLAGIGLLAMPAYDGAAVQDPFHGDGRTIDDAGLDAVLVELATLGIEPTEDEYGDLCWEDLPKGWRMLAVYVIESVSTRPSVADLAESLTQCRSALGLSAGVL